MAIDTKHPKYEEMMQTWMLLRDSFEGEEAVKDKGTLYLKPTPGQVLDGVYLATPAGTASYDAYKSRAVFPDFFTAGVETLVGILNAKDAQFDLPEQMKPLLEQAALTGEGLQAVLRKIHEQQLITGRVGIMGDLPAKAIHGDPQMYIVMYEAEKIINWDDGSFNAGLDKLNLVVLDESGKARYDDFLWKDVKKHRILSLGALSENSEIGVYKYAVQEQASTTGSDANKNQDPNPDDGNSSASLQFETPVIKGDPSSDIPCVFIGSKDLVRDPDRPPLLGLARICMTIYRGEADYRQTLFMQGQDTLVVVGGVRNAGADGSAPLRVGAGARIDVDVNGDAKYVGIGATGLPEQRMALEADRSLAAVRTGQLLAPGKMSMESGEALKTRIAAQTATLTSVAITAAAGLEQLLRIMAKWAGYDPEKVKVTPNLDFTNVAIQGQDIVQLQTAKGLGFPISAQSLHEMAKDRGLTRNTFEQEMKLIKEEPEELMKHALAVAEAGKSLAGNNPQQQAGGPAGSVAGKGKKSNEPKK
jgi:hypothetical protein